MATDNSFDISPAAKGSYRRRTDDIFRALKILNADGLSPVAAFLFEYYACEKLAKIMIGVNAKNPASDYFGSKNYQLRINNIKGAALGLACAATDQDIDQVFAYDLTSARLLRNKIAHDLGPTHAQEIRDNAKRLVPYMRKFLACGEQVISYLERTYSA